MPSAVSRDPADPSFPHGTSAGRLRGCDKDYPCPASPSCWEVRCKALKARAVERARGLGGNVDAARVLLHVQYLLQNAPAGTKEQSVVRAAGLASSTISHMRKHNRCRRSTADAILALTPEQVASQTRFVPYEEFEFLARTMQALGYSFTWQAQRSGVEWMNRGLTPRLHRPFETVHIDTYNAVAELAEQVGTRFAEPARDGTSPTAITHAKRYARQAGFHPPQMYDENRKLIVLPDGTPDWRLLPGHAWERATSNAGRTLEALDLMQRTGRSANECGDECGALPETLLRYRKAMGWVYLKPRMPGENAVLDREASAGALAMFDEQYAAYVAGEVDPLLVLLNLRATHVADSQLPKGHPAKQAFVANDQALSKAAERRAQEALRRKRESRARRTPEQINADTRKRRADRKAQAARSSAA